MKKLSVHHKSIFLFILVLYILSRLVLFVKYILPSGLYPPLPIDDGWYDYRYGFLWANGLLNIFPSAYIHPSREIYGWIIGHLLYFFDRIPHIPILFQIVMGGFALFSLKRLCTLIFNSFTAYLAVIIWAFYGLAILYDVQILKYSLTISCMIITLDYYYQARFLGGSLNYILFSFFACLLLMLRLEYLPAIVWFIGSFFYKTNKFRPVMMLSILVFLGLILAFFLPSLYKTHLGIHTYMGNSVNSIGRFMDIPGILPNTSGHVSCAYELEPLLREKFNRYAFLNNFWLQKTLDIIVTNPLHFVLTTIRKFFTLMSKTEDFSSVRIDYPLYSYSFFHFPWFSFQFVFVLAFPGLIINLKNSKSYALYIVLFVICLSLVFTIIGKPYRLQLVPVLACFAAHSLYLLLNRRFVLRVLSYSIVALGLTYLPHSNHLISSKSLKEYLSMEKVPFACVKKNEQRFIQFLKDPRHFDSEEIYNMAREYFDANLMEDASLLFHYLLDNCQLSWEEQNYTVRSLIICYITLERYVKAESLLKKYNPVYFTNLVDLRKEVQEMKTRIFLVEQYQ